MSTAERTPAWFDNFKARLDGLTEHKADDISTLRKQAIDALKTEPLPVRKMERWRYTPVDGLFNLPLSLLPSESANDTDLSELFTTGVDAYRYIVANGRASFTGNADDLPDGVIIDTLHQAKIKHKKLLDQYIGSAMNHVAYKNKLQTPFANKDSKLFQYLNQSSSPDGLFIYVPKHVKLIKPVEAVYLKSGNDAELVQTHGLIILEANSEMTFVEKHVSDTHSNSFCNNQMELVMNAQATMKHYYIQQQALENWHRNAIHRIQDSESKYQGWFGCCGSQWSRLEMDAFFTGEKATSEVQGVQLAAKGQVNDVHLDVRHDQPNCHSEQHFRGLVSDKSKIIFDGNITVSQDAQKTVAHLSDNNLMLSRNAEVDTKPQLEIYADDVQCSHGTSIGEIDEGQIFYLRSRGISEEQAKNLLSIGFVAELIEKIDLDPVKDLMLDILKRQLQDSKNEAASNAG